MNIIVTGAAGFLGFSLSINLLKSKHTVFGIDNLNNYYSLKYKKKRLKELRKFKNFKFSKIDISDFKKLNSFFKKKRIDMIIHFAAQAGVRFSVSNPQNYISSNISGFINILELAKEKSIKKIFYASSSSVYGDNKNYPWKEFYKPRPVSLYAKTKQFNEKIGNFYFRKYNMQIVGFRFFTIFGEWGRPDMFLFKLFKSIISKKTLNINNYGKHLRDFTYISDVTKILMLLIKKKFKRHELINICSSKPISLLEILSYFKNYKFSIKKIGRNKLDVRNTHGDNSKLKKILKKKFTFADKKESIKNTFDWYKENNIINIT